MVSVSTGALSLLGWWVPPHGKAMFADTTSMRVPGTQSTLYVLMKYMEIVQLVTAELGEYMLAVFSASYLLPSANGRWKFHTA